MILSGYPMTLTVVRIQHEAMLDDVARRRRRRRDRGIIDSS
ncbi:MAG TPA: hypothetical protein VFR99_04800 [Marmoricola sp.]|jgi:hypothetical protein|nr:hypothetical protein [Marmoricola sp.]